MLDDKLAPNTKKAYNVGWHRWLDFLKVESPLENAYKISDGLLAAFYTWLLKREDLILKVSTCRLYKDSVKSVWREYHNLVPSD